MNYTDILGPDGETVNMGGLTQRFFFARVSDFLALQEPISNPATPGDLVSIATTHTFKTGKCFNVGYCTMDKGKFDSEVQGDLDGHSVKQTAEVFVPGSHKDLHGFAAKSMNDRFIGILEMPDGTNLQMGNKMFYMTIKGKFTTSTNSAGVRGYTFTFESMGPKNLVYSGAVSLTPAP
jgi:hypothetical protein